MRDKVLIFIPYQDSDNFLSDGILTREFAMLNLCWAKGFTRVINAKKPRTFLDKKRYEIHEDFYPNGTIEGKVRGILKNAETVQYQPFLDIRQIIARRGWWNAGYSETKRKINLQNNTEYLVYSDNPYAAELLSFLKGKNCKVYFDVMDNFAIHPSLNESEHKLALAGYKRIFSFADCISANSVQTCEFMQKYTDKKIILVKNGVFENNEVHNHNTLPQINSIKEAKAKYSRCVGYIGKLGLRLDAELIDAVSSRCPNILFVFVGNCLKGQINTKLLELFDSRENVVHIDGVPSAYVYAVLNEFDILSIPHSVGKNENGGDPLKLYQYLTRNKPIITTPILGVDEFSDCIMITDKIEEWIQFIEDSGDRSTYNEKSKFTWESRVEPVMKELGIK